MLKAICLICISLSWLVFQTQAVSYVNNATVPSDILTKLFFEQIQNNPNLLNVSAQRSGTYDPQNCILGLKEIVNRFPSFDVLPFIDAWGTIPSGILYGHFQDLGNFDQCIETSVVLSEETGLVNGQYCFASFPLISPHALDLPPLGIDARVQSRALAELLRISIAICVPDTCEPSVLNEIFQQAADNVFNGAISKISVNRCQTAKKPDFKAINIVGIVIFSIIGAMMVLSTVYDLYMDYFEKPAVPILLAFSIITNGRKLFVINTTKSPSNIDCLLGIRVLSMVWVMFCHNYSITPMLPLVNIIELIPWFKAASSMHITMATVSVDSFLFMSGLLVAWLGFRELDKTNGKLNIPQMYFHRYIRLTPPIAAVILFLVSINRYVGIGPYRQIFYDFHHSCETTWWSTLLYIQNYASPENNCVAQSWYLAVDTQLYVLSPLILIPLWKWGKKFVPVVVTLTLLSMGCVIATYFTEGYTDLIGLLEENQSRLTYTPTHTRYPVWLVGVGLGYFMYKNRDKSMRPSKLVQLLGWIVCFTTILAIIYGPYFTINSDHTTVFEAAMFESFRRVSWAIALSWIVFACHFQFGGVVNSFLSHPFWQPLARLTYSLYLVHMAVQTIQYGITRTDVHFSDYTEILFVWSTFGISLIAAIALTLAFESPVLVIEKALLSAAKDKQSQKQDAAVKAENIESSHKYA